VSAPREPAAELRSVTTSDRRTLRYRVWSQRASRRGTVVLLNGVMSHSEWMSPIALPLAELGYHVVGADRRGSGRNEQGRGTELDRRQLLDDLRRIVEAESLSGSTIALAGWCWGATLAVHAALDPANRVERLALLTPALFPAAAVRDVIADRNAAARELAPDTPLLESPIREEMFTRGPALEGLILRDALRVRRFSPRFFWNMNKIGALATRRLEQLDLPLLLLLARRDEAVDNEETRRQLCARLASEPRTAWVDAAHGIQFEAPAEVAEALSVWLEEAAPTERAVGP